MKQMDLSTEMQIVDNVFVKMMQLDINQKVQGHAHTFDHITLLSRGRVVMRAKDKEMIYDAPKLIVTPKEIVHEFQALAPFTVLCCIHAVRNGDTEDDIAPPNISKEEAQQLLAQFPLAKWEGSNEGAVEA